MRSTLLKRLASAVRLAPAERHLALRATWGLVVARVSLATVGFTRLRASLESVPTGGPAAGDGFARDVRRALERAVRTLPSSSCLAQSIVAYRLLRRAGFPAVLTIGVAKGGSHVDPLLAHAWVSCGGVIVTGDADGAGEADPARYTPLAQIGGA